MRTLILIVGMAFSLIFFDSNAFAFGDSLPPGNYLASCNLCSMHGHQLTCLCQAKNGSWLNDTARISHRCDDVENDNGQLQCNHYSHHHRHHRWRHHHHHHHWNRIRDISAGPIWNNYDAQQKCPNVCGNDDARWTGQWNTVVWGQNSICECER